MRPASVILSATILAGALSAYGCHSRAPVVDMPPVNGTVVGGLNLRYIDFKSGSGRKAVVGKCVYTHYTVFLARNKRKVESSHDLNADGSPGQPVGFLLGARQVIAGWDLGFQDMLVGGQRRLFVPYRSGYGEKAHPPSIPPKSDLVFDVEVMAVADSLPHAARSGSAGAVSSPSQTCPSWRAVNAAR